MQYWFGSYVSAARLAAELHDPIVCMHRELSCIKNIVIYLLLTLTFNGCVKEQRENTANAVEVYRKHDGISHA